MREEQYSRLSLGLLRHVHAWARIHSHLPQNTDKEKERETEVAQRRQCGRHGGTQAGIGMMQPHIKEWQPLKEEMANPPQEPPQTVRLADRLTFDLQNFKGEKLQCTHKEGGQNPLRLSYVSRVKQV